MRKVDPEKEFDEEIGGYIGKNPELIPYYKIFRRIVTDQRDQIIYDSVILCRELFVQGPDDPLYGFIEENVGRKYQTWDQIKDIIVATGKRGKR